MTHGQLQTLAIPDTKRCPEGVRYFKSCLYLVKKINELLYY